ncbi:MAG TPA: hypothetical protein VLB80_05320 [Candidatus Babeliales bacterium]|nr:hypothetical protein [Candidatus Babeliales bacterium]
MKFLICGILLLVSFYGLLNTMNFNQMNDTSYKLSIDEKLKELKYKQSLLSLKDKNVGNRNKQENSLLYQPKKCNNAHH